jgi:hypothetical protein
MQFIGYTKIGKVNPKPDFIYPIIRLPPSCSDLIGKKANIYEATHQGKYALLITFDGEVVQPVSVEDRLTALEKMIESLTKTQINYDNKDNKLQKGLWSSGYDIAFTRRGSAVRIRPSP